MWKCIQKTCWIGACFKPQNKQLGISSAALCLSRFSGRKQSASHDPANSRLDQQYGQIIFGEVPARSD